MMIYTKTNAHHGLFEQKFFRNLSQAKFEENAIYWYDQHDLVIRGTPFNSFIDKPHWEHLQRDPTAKIFIFYGDEYYNLLDLEDWVKTLKKWNIRPQQVYIMCLDKVWLSWTIAKFAEFDYVGVNIQDYNFLMKRVEFQKEQPIVKRFSALSRNYNTWRLDLYASLFERKLLDNFNYTFCNMNPYGKIFYYPHEQVKQDFAELGHPLTEEASKWIEGMPYTLKNDHVKEKLAQDAFDMITTAGINLIVESHFDPFWHFKGHRKLLHPLDLSPSFPTEKTYKPIACSRPFMIFSTPFFLKELRQQGFKTFHPYIDETYDTIIDEKQRLAKLVEEIERLCSLPQEKFDAIMSRCLPIAKFNFKVMQKLKADLDIVPEFAWLKPYFNHNLPAPGRGGEI